MITKLYSEETKINSINLRRKFPSTIAKLPFLERHKLWVEFVNKSNLTKEQKEACIEEFLNPKDLERYNKKREK